MVVRCGGGIWGVKYLVAGSRVFASIAGRREAVRGSWHKSRKREGESSEWVSRGEAHSQYPGLQQSFRTLLYKAAVLLQGPTEKKAKNINVNSDLFISRLKDTQ